MKTLLLCLLLASSASAQSTTLGRTVFSAADVWWERMQKRNPWLYRIDDTPQKTWAVHGALTLAGGYALSKVTPLSLHNGLRVMAGFYVAREVWNVAAEGNRKYGDATMDALVPVMISELRFSVRLAR